MSLIQAVNLNHSYGHHPILKNINLYVNKGEVLALIGPTGAGKTTLLRILDLLEKPCSGQIYFDGVDVNKSRKLQLQTRRRMSYVHQKPIVFSTDVFNNVAYALRWRHIKGTAVRSKAKEVLNLVGLAGYENRSAKTLSGGETQRVAIARALVTEPEVLFLDEPTANLDPRSTIQMEELIQSIFRQYQTTIIMATHDLSQGQRLAQRIGVIVNGEIVQMGKADEVFSSPLNHKVAEFVGFENIISGVITAQDGEVVTIDIKGKPIEAISHYAVGEEVYACIRSEDVTLAPAQAVSSARNSLIGEIASIKVKGSLAQVAVDCGFPLVALVTRRSAEELALDRGRRVYVSFKATAVHVIRKR